jgi:hypothetical protein
MPDSGRAAAQNDARPLVTYLSRAQDGRSRVRAAGRELVWLYGASRDTT